MDLELTIGTALISGLSVLAYRVGHRAGKNGYSHPIHFAIALISSVALAWSVSGNLRLANMLPSGYAVFCLNFVPVTLSFCAGLASTSQGLGQRCRAATITGLSLLTLGYALGPVIRPTLAPATPSALSQWKNDVCLQSHPATCAPAAAATLLRSAGVFANEQELVAACLTSRYGTEPLGLFRGLAVASSDQAFCPRVASSNPEVWSSQGQVPNIALVRFQYSHKTGSLDRLLGPQGDGHAVVILGREGKGWSIADPAFGRTTWTDEQFRSRFTGDAIYLHHR